MSLVQSWKRRSAQNRVGLEAQKDTKGEESAAFDKFRRHMKKLGLGSVFRPNILRAWQNRLIEPSVSPKDAVNYAADHLFERSSVVSKSAFLKCAIERLGATVSYKKIFEEFGAQDGPSPRFAMVDALAQRLGMRESVVFLDTQSDIEALGFSPEAAAETMENLDKKGFFNSDDGKIYMLSGHFKNGVDAFRTFVHENGHRVADAMRASPEFSGMLRRVEELAGGEENLRAMLPGSYQNEKVQTLAEEYLMRVVERVALEQTVNARQRGVWAFFKERLRKWFGGETFASAADREIAEIARDILRRAESPASETGAEPSRWSAVTPENNGKRAEGFGR